MQSAYIFRVQRYSIHDGPGIRTLVFFSGCPMRCAWCANPEGIGKTPQVRYIKSYCNGCGKCLECPNGAVTFQEENGFSIDAQNCKKCGACIANCARKAKIWWGERITLEELLEKIEADRVFYETSGGGVTLGGGDPLFQGEFVLELLKQCRARGIDAALETEACCEFGILREAAALCSTLFTDLKAWDSVKHRKLTGVDNAVVLENFSGLAKWMRTVEQPPKWVIRIPLLPGENFSLIEFEETARYLKELGSFSYVEIMPFHNLGEHKYEQLGLPYQYSGRGNVRPEDVEDYAQILRNTGIPVKISEW